MCFAAQLVLTILLVLAPRAGGAPVNATWLGPAGAGGDGNWWTAANWSTGVVPRNIGTTAYSVFIDGERPASSVVSDPGQIELAHLTIGAGDGLRLPNGAWVTLAGDPGGTGPRLHNAGTIWLESTVGTTYLVVDDGTLTLSGGGTILFGAGDQNSITGSYRVHNLDNYIAGRGRIQTSLTNAGTVSANLAGRELQILYSATNSGTILATSGGVLRLGGGLTNTGTLLATPGSTLHLEAGTFNNAGASQPIRVDAGTLQLGTAATWSGATLSGAVQLVGASTFQVSNATVTGSVDIVGAGTTILSNARLTGATFLNSGAGLVRVTAGTANTGAFVNPAGGVVHIENGGALDLNGSRTFHNDGEIVIDGTGTLTSLGVSFGTATLAGTGSVRLTDSAHNMIGGSSFGGGTERLHNLGNTIHGRGAIRQSFVNAGTIAANLPGRTLELQAGPSAPPINTGTILAQNGGVLRFGGSFNNAGGLVRVDSAAAASSLLLEGAGIIGGTVDFAGSGGTITLHNGYIVDGHLSVGDGNLLRVTQGGGLGGSVHIPATSEIELDPSTSITVRAGSTFHNAGCVAVRGGAVTVMHGTLTLRGGGSVSLINGARLQGTFGSSFSSLVNHDNLIHGGGTIWSFGQGIVNGPGGTIRAEPGAGSLSISQVFSTGTFLNQGTLAVPVDAWLSLGLEARQASGLTLVDGRLWLEAPRLYTITGGTLAGSGTVEGFGRIVMEGGTLAPGGAAPGSIGNGLVVTGTLTLGAAATTAIDVAPDGQADAFGATYANLGGTLRVEPVNGYAPAWLDEFLITKWGQRTGRFASYEFVGAAPGFAYAPTYHATSLTLTYARRGDANLDGAVNLQDFNALAANFGATGAEWSQADFDLDGVVNLRDFNLLAGNFGLAASRTNPTPADWAALATAVPEPAGWAVALVTLALARRRFRGHRGIERLRVLVAAAAAAAVSVLTGVGAADAQTASWVAPVSGNWSDSTKWSTHPQFPNSASFTAVIGAAGPAYTVDLAEDVTVGTLSITSPAATVRQTAGHLTSTQLAVGDGVGSDGNYVMSGGTLSVTGGMPGVSGGLQIGGTAGDAGRGGFGTFIQTGGLVRATNNITVGFGSGGGTLLISGAGSRVECFDEAPFPIRTCLVGIGADGFLAMSDGATARIGRLFVGAAVGQGTLHVRDNASLEATGIVIGTNSSWLLGGAFYGDGTLLLAGAGAHLRVGNGSFQVGDQAGGAANAFVESGATLRIDAASTPAFVRRSGTLTLNGGIVDAARNFSVVGGRLTVNAGTLAVPAHTLFGSTVGSTEFALIRVNGGHVSAASINLSRGILTQRGGVIEAGTIALTDLAAAIDTTAGHLSVGTMSVPFGDVQVHGAGRLTVGQRLDVSGNGVLYVAGGTLDGAGVVRVTSATLIYDSGTFEVGGIDVATDRVYLTPGRTGTLRANSFAMTVGGRMDLADRAMVIDYTGISPGLIIGNRIKAAFASGLWTGPGIYSSVAAGDPSHGVGYAEASQLFTTFPATFAGQVVDETSVVVSYARIGDANLDGVVDLRDFNRLAGGFGVGNEWVEGDFTYNGIVNLQDFNAFAGLFGLSAGPDGVVDPADWAAFAAAVPEPGTLVSGTVLMATLRRRRPRRRFAGN